MNRTIKFDIISRRSDGKLEHNYMTLEEIEQADVDEFDYEVVARRQYVGCKDKNGQEVYENDIMVHRMHGRFVVTWDEGMLAFGAEGIDGWELSEAEVIGNTFERKHLLEEEA